MISTSLLLIIAAFAFVGLGGVESIVFCKFWVWLDWLDFIVGWGCVIVSKNLDYLLLSYRTDFTDSQTI